MANTKNPTEIIPAYIPGLFGPGAGLPPGTELLKNIIKILPAVSARLLAPIIYSHSKPTNPNTEPDFPRRILPGQKSMRLVPALSNGFVSLPGAGKSVFVPGYQPATKTNIVFAGLPGKNILPVSPGAAAYSWACTRGIQFPARFRSCSPNQAASPEYKKGISQAKANQNKYSSTGILKISHPINRLCSNENDQALNTNRLRYSFKTCRGITNIAVRHALPRRIFPMRGQAQITVMMAIPQKNRSKIKYQGRVMFLYFPAEKKPHTTI